MLILVRNLQYLITSKFILVYLSKNVSIDKNVILYPNVTIHDNSIIGKNCILNSGSIIGSDGFGWIKREKGWIKVPQIGRTLLRDDCEVGSNTVIDRGTIQDTIISQGVKLDNNIQIGIIVLLMKIL